MGAPKPPPQPPAPPPDPPPDPHHTPNPPEPARLSFKFNPLLLHFLHGSPPGRPRTQNGKPMVVQKCFPDLPGAPSGTSGTPKRSRNLIRNRPVCGRLRHRSLVGWPKPAQFAVTKHPFPLRVGAPGRSPNELSYISREIDGSKNLQIQICPWQQDVADRPNS